MIWLLLTVLCIGAWGITDILYKKSSDYRDRLSHLKGIVWIGIAMAAAMLVLMPFYHTPRSLFRLVTENLSLAPVGLLYPVALIFGLMGKRHLEASVVSPLENIDGAMAALILYGYFAVSGKKDIIGTVSPVDLAATVLIVLGVVLLGVQEHRFSKQEQGLSDGKKRHRLGAFALMFPLVYNLVDAVSMVTVGLAVSGELSNAISDIDFFFLETLCFQIVALAAWIYMAAAKKLVYNPFRKGELVRCGAAVGETVGTFTYVMAVAYDPILTAPVTSSYCLITVFTARIFLKERLTKKQYLCLSMLLIGIVMLGVSEIIKG